MWDKCKEFHGHECPGLAIGYRAAEIAKEILGLDRSKDEEIVCITENDACGVDAIQLVLGCTMGKGNLIYRDRGKNAYTFFNRETEKSIRLVFKKIDEKLNREEKIDYILKKDVEYVFDIKPSKYKLPEKARIYKTIYCEK